MSSGRESSESAKASTTTGKHGHGKLPARLGAEEASNSQKLNTQGQLSVNTLTHSTKAAAWRQYAHAHANTTVTQLTNAPPERSNDNAKHAAEHDAAARMNEQRRPKKPAMPKRSGAASKSTGHWRQAGSHKYRSCSVKRRLAFSCRSRNCRGDVVVKLCKARMNAKGARRESLAATTSKTAPQDRRRHRHPCNPASDKAANAYSHNRVAQQ